jgi:hypothetical protein
MSPDDIEQAGQSRLPFCAIATTRPWRFFNSQGSLPFDYSPILLLKPFGFRIAPDTLSSSE